MIVIEYKKASEIVDIRNFSEFVAEKHKHQRRRDGSPYFQHCVNVAECAKKIAISLNESEIGVNVIEVAAYGHDLIEDTNTDYDDIVKRSCDEVAALIAFVSDDKRLPSVQRHSEYLLRLATAPRRAQIVKLADIIDNANDSLKLFKNFPTSHDFLRKWQRRACHQLTTLCTIQTSHYVDEAFTILAELNKLLAINS